MLGNKDKLKLQAPPDVRYSNKNRFPITSKCPYISKTAFISGRGLTMQKLLLLLRKRPVEIGSKLPDLSAAEFEIYNRLGELMDEVVSITSL